MRRHSQTLRVYQLVMEWLENPVQPNMTIPLYNGISTYYAPSKEVGPTPTTRHLHFRLIPDYRSTDPKHRWMAQSCSPTATVIRYDPNWRDVLAIERLLRQEEL